MPEPGPDLVVNDIHSALNRTVVRRVVRPATRAEAAEAVREAARDGLAIAISGSRHAMGGQQFLRDGVLIDTRSLARTLSFDFERGLLRVEAGIEWPALIRSYLHLQAGAGAKWGIVQKQTGADHFTLGGTLSANAHGRGLLYAPIIEQVEAFTLLLADGREVICSREHQAELFGLVIGGAGLFGIILDVTLRLAPRQRIERVVELLPSSELMPAFEQRIRDGYLYGDFQFVIDECSPQFLQFGVFSCYRPTDQPVPERVARELSDEDWMDHLFLAYTDRPAAFRTYADYYLSTHGQVYWSDTHQLGPYVGDYLACMRERGAVAEASSLVITEVYVPRHCLQGFLAQAAKLLRERGTVVIYGTVRLIEQDRESFLAWAREAYACVIFNLLVQHSAAGQEHAAGSFRALIDLALSFGGSYYPIYHRYATRGQMEACFPQFGRFLEQKRRYDPEERFQSDWYRHCATQWQQRDG